MTNVSGKERRRAQVLAAVEASIRESGDVSFSMKELAEKAEVSFATPFNLFGKKEDILAALLNTRIVEQAQLTTERTHHESGFEALLHVASDSCAGYTSDAELFKPLLQAMRPRPTERNRSMEMRATDIWKSALLVCADDKTIKKSTDIDALARRLHLGFRTIVSMWASEALNDEEFQEQALLHVIACLLTAVTPKGRGQINRLDTAQPL